MKDIKDLVVAQRDTILAVMGVIERGSSRFAAVVNQDSEFVGTVTDGDIRRGLLNGLTVQDTITKVLNAEPFFIFTDEDFISGVARAKQMGIEMLPILHRDKKIKDIVKVKNLQSVQIRREEPVILMAGGLGKRLRPHTNDCPKPLLKLTSDPLLEIILTSFSAQGFFKFFISVNYKAQMVEDYFQDGRQWGVNIEYIREDRELGTAGALSIIKDELPSGHPVFVMNGDVLTKTNFHHMLVQHKETRSSATVGVREHVHEVPYGVLQTDPNGFVTDIKEKPQFNYSINAGVYLLNREVLDVIPFNKYYTMPELLTELVRRDARVSSYKIDDYWIDVGRVEDFERAQVDFEKHF